MSEPIDITGQVFNKLTVIRYDHIGNFGRSYWLCRCTCGREKVISRSSLIDGSTKSCGCIPVGGHKELIYITDHNTNCWTCVSHTRKGEGTYPTTMIDGVNTRISRLTFKDTHPEVLVNGEIPADMVVRHTCDNSKCINPEHLILGTQADNVQDCVDRNRRVYVSGEKHYNSKLSKNQVVEIINNTTEPQAALAERYNVSSACVSAIKCGRTWRRELLK